MQHSLLVAGLVCVGASTQLLSSVEAYAKYVKLVPNGANVPDAPAIGHLDDTGTTGTNAFGDAFAKAGNEWTTALCQADSDGDGYTNGQELGDPCCTWTTTSTADLIASGISHPGDATKTPSNAELIAGCSSTSTAASTTADSAASASASTTTAPATTTAAPTTSSTTSSTTGTVSAADTDGSLDTSVVTTTAPSASSASGSTTAESASASGSSAASSINVAFSVVAMCVVSTAAAFVGL